MQKGFAPILIVIIIATLVGGYLIYQNSFQVSPPIQTSTTVLPTPPPITSPSVTITEANNNLIIIPHVFKENPKDENPYDIVIKVPQESVIKNTEKTLILNGSKYRIAGENPMAGLCPMEDYGKSCTYTDETNIGKVKILRIWRDSSGVFALNPQSIPLDEYSINNFKIFKESPNKAFTQEEINLWKGLLEKIEIVPSEVTQ